MIFDEHGLWTKFIGKAAQNIKIRWCFIQKDKKPNLEKDSALKNW